VWADFPRHYREDFDEEPDDPVLFRWMKRRKHFFFGPPDLRKPGAPGPPLSEQDERERGMRDMRTGRRMVFLRLLRNFESTVTDGEMLAGRPVYHVSLVPRIPRRPQFRFRVDKEFGTILQFEILHKREGKWIPHYREYFTEISYNPDFDETIFSGQEDYAFRPYRRSESPHGNVQELSSIDELVEEIKTPVIIPDSIPEGFSLERIRIMTRHGNDMIHLHYSDGVYAFSLFQSVEKIPPPFLRMMKERELRSGGDVNLRHKGRTVLFKHIPPLNIIMVGNCQSSLLESVLNSLKPEHIRLNGSLRIND
jgi:hypothetical protein